MIILLPFGKVINMEENILHAAYQLMDALKEDPRVVKLNDLEEQLNNNDEAKILSYKMDMASVEYSDALKHFLNKSEEIKPYIKALQDSKIKLNELDIVKEYNKAYKDVKDLINKINDEIFNEFRIPLTFKN